MESIPEIIAPHMKSVNRAFTDMRETVKDDFDAHFRQSIESMQAHGLLDEERAAVITQTVAVQETFTERFAAYSAGEQVMTSCETAAGASAETVLHTVASVQECARELIITAIDNDAITQDSKEHLHEASKLSSEELIRLCAVTLELTKGSGRLISRVSSTLLGGINAESTKEKSAHLDFNVIKIGDQENHQQVAEVAIDALRNRKVVFDTPIPGTVSRALIQTYRQWVDIRRELKQRNGYSLAVAIAKQAIATATREDSDAASAESIQELVTKAQTEIDRTIADHVAFAHEFRPTWNQLKGAGLRTFSNELRRPEAGLPPNIDTPTSKRYTGVLHTLERLGKTEPEALQEKFSKILTREFILGQSIERVCNGIAAAGGTANTAEWLPVSADLDFIIAHRNELQVLMRKDWVSRKDSTVPQAVDAIGAALRAYADAKKEFEHPERRLERIAQSLGAVALPPEARPELKLFNREQRRQNARNALQSAANNEKFDQNIRQRSLVIDHFLDVAAGQARPEDRDDFGQLYITDPVKNGARYFCVSFRAPDEQEWILLESLRPKVASYVIPKTLVSQFGTLGGFIKSFYKREMQELGSQQVIHVTDWTIGSHINAIVSKIAAIDSQ